MKSITRTRLFILFMLFTVLLPYTFQVKASKTNIVSGEWATVEYTSDCFPDYEEFNIFIMSTGKIAGFEDYYNDTLIYLRGYRITINKTQIAYVKYDNVEDYIPPREIKHLYYDAGDFNITELGYGYHRMTMEIYAGTVDQNTSIYIPDEYLVFETFFDQEITLEEWIIITITIGVPLSLFALVVFTRYFLDKHFIENVTFRNMVFFGKRFVKEVLQNRFGHTFSVFARARARRKAKKNSLKEKKTNV